MAHEVPRVCPASRSHEGKRRRLRTAVASWFSPPAGPGDAGGLNAVVTVARRPCFSSGAGTRTRCRGPVRVPALTRREVSWPNREVPCCSPGARPAATSARTSSWPTTPKTCKFARAGRRQPQIGLVARPASPAQQGREPRTLLRAAWRGDGRLALETRIHHRAGLWLRGSGGRGAPRWPREGGLWEPRRRCLSTSESRASWLDSAKSGSLVMLIPLAENFYLFVKGEAWRVR